MSEAASNLPLAESSDAVLIARIRAGEGAAYGTLYERHLGAARGLARQLADGDAAEDAVQDTFAKILEVIQRGGGPRNGFRPYLLTAVRRTIYDRHRNERRLQSTDRIEQYDPGLPFIDPALEGLERSMVVRAFQSLPERWQAVLWHTEIEEAKPADIAPLLGLSANGVAALAYRAREGLRQAYLQMHLAAASTGSSAQTAAPDAGPVVDERCRPILEKLGSYVRGGLAKRDSRSVERHLDKCKDCKGIYAELADVNTSLRNAVGPLILGTATTAYLSSQGGLASGGPFGWFRNLPKRQQQGVGGAAATAAIAAALLALALVSADHPIRPAPPPPPVAAQPEPGDPKAPGARPQPRPQPPVPSPRPRSPRAHPVVQPSPPPPAHLTAGIGTVGALLRGQDGIVAMAVRNSGTSPSKDVTAHVDLPPGVTYLGGATGRNAAMFRPARPPGDGWACRPAPGSGQGATTGATSTGSHTTSLGTPSRTGDEPGDSAGGGMRVRCTHAPLGPGAKTTAYLHVHVSSSASQGTPPSVRLRSGDVRASAKAPAGVTPEGMPARFAADGRLRTVETGNALLSCDERIPACRRSLNRQGRVRDNDFWRMRPIDRDRNSATRSSSAARLALPPDAKVLWAGLYWSGTTGASGHGAWRMTAKLRPPRAARYQRIRADEVAHVRLPTGMAYQAFADVTSLVRENGAGVWWGADVLSSRGFASYAGWGLVTVVTDPEAPHQQAMVLDSAVLAGSRNAERLAIPLHGLLASARPARIGLVAWEGDAGLRGDRLLLDGRPLTPIRGGGTGGNVLDGSSSGAIGPSLTFGTDVDAFASRLGAGRALVLATRRDAVLTGVVTVTAPMSE